MWESHSLFFNLIIKFLLSNPEKHFTKYLGRLKSLQIIFSIYASSDRTLLFTVAHIYVKWQFPRSSSVVRISVLINAF